MAIQGDWDVFDVKDRYCGVTTEDILTIDAAGNINKQDATLWGTVNPNHLGGTVADATATVTGKPYKLKIDDNGLLKCLPQVSNNTDNFAVRFRSLGGRENGGVKILPWMISLAVGILVGVLLGIALGVSPADAFCIGFLSAIGAFLLYQLTIIQDPPATWTANAGGGGQGLRTLPPRETDVSRPA